MNGLDLKYTFSEHWCVDFLFVRCVVPFHGKIIIANVPLNLTGHPELHASCFDNVLKSLRYIGLLSYCSGCGCIFQVSLST